MQHPPKKKRISTEAEQETEGFRGFSFELGQGSPSPRPCVETGRLPLKGQQGVIEAAIAQYQDQTQTWKSPSPTRHTLHPHAKIDRGFSFLGTFGAGQLRQNKADPRPALPHP